MFREKIAEIVGHGISLDGQDPAANAHDAMWAVALGLNATYTKIDTKRLESYAYGDMELTTVMKENFGRVSFYGVSVMYFCKTHSHFFFRYVFLKNQTNYQNKNIYCAFIVAHSFDLLLYLSISQGPVSFSEEGDRIGLFLVEQNRGKLRKKYFRT